MHSTSYTVLGVMSGTSLDGLDLAYVRFKREAGWSYELLVCETIPYPEAWVVRLQDAVDLSPEELKSLDIEYTAYLAKTITTFRDRNPLKIDAIASHGHTILHRPDQGVTYQIGNRSELAKSCKILVVFDFRIEDVALGGQGAPLVPIGDRLLFEDFKACLNIGGFANISFEQNDKRIAYDICPTNIVLNHLTRQLGFDFDKDGAIAASGAVDGSLLNELNNLGFYKESFPKSLGLEWVKREIFPILNQSKATTENKIATFTEHMAVQLAANINLLANGKRENRVLVTGGGAYNNYLIKRTQHLSQIKLEIPDAKTIEFKEALIFAFMGVLRLRNSINVLNSVTGASKNHCAGIVCSP
ncbi:anhydro-N-acetylmuramic acid kinase [Leeuwenhoekiella polynyae]|uniref:Anhydro-N-acetylmuramic acid kinase n=1 Tax=Leeuwenhoekiella polynyae TaxID=1550906 RepID=A0A4Q0PGQ1_9FLAO|nr:anhydro-N-acetylmuramic acid kinase [Leeuwenhoekiella polynyae]RXG25389.1 anhydro-N-acetylmuramic acid kinase [Leeuwenhoekiella polynyae]